MTDYEKVYRGQPVIHAFFVEREATWSQVLERKGFLFFRKGAPALMRWIVWVQRR